MIWRGPVDDYSGRLNFLASVGVALLFVIVMMGFSGHDHDHMDAVKTASASPVATQAK